MRTRLAIALSLSLVFGCASTSVSARPSSEGRSETEVRAAVADLADAFTKGDGERAASHASTDLLLIHPTRGDVDHAEFTGGARAGLKPYNGYKLTEAKVDNIIVSGPIAVVSITWHTVMHDPAGKESTRGERDQEVWRREADGRWRLFRGASFPLPAPGYQTA